MYYVILQKVHVWKKSGSKMFSTNQIEICFLHQFLWKESRDILVISHGVSLQAKAASEKIVVWLDVGFANQIT